MKRREYRWLPLGAVPLLPAGANPPDINGASQAVLLFDRGWVNQLAAVGARQKTTR